MNEFLHYEDYLNCVTFSNYFIGQDRNKVPLKHSNVAFPKEEICVSTILYKAEITYGFSISATMKCISASSSYRSISD